MSGSFSNYISEWYGVRLYPSASGVAGAVSALQNRRCPFLSDALGAPAACIKSPNSAGVCTITTTRNGLKDWIICPYRALERQIVNEVTRRIFADHRERVPLFPVVQLRDEARRTEILDRACGEPVYVFFQDKLGGEINVSGSDVTPELSFDITIGGLDWAERDVDTTGDSWIMVIAPDRYPTSGYAKLEIRKELRMRAQTLIHQAFR